MSLVILNLCSQPLQTFGKTICITKLEELVVMVMRVADTSRMLDWTPVLFGPSSNFSQYEAKPFA
jgi:hypothetical protein